MCNYIGLKNFMLIDGIFYPIGHTSLNDQHMGLQNSYIIALYKVNDFSHLYQLGDSEWLENSLNPYFSVFYRGLSMSAVNYLTID